MFIIGTAHARASERQITQKIGITSCAVTEITIRRSPFNTTRQDLGSGHQIRGQAEWSMNNQKDPILRRMIKVLSGMTKGSDLLSFLKDRNCGKQRRKKTFIRKFKTKLFKSRDSSSLQSFIPR